MAKGTADGYQTRTRNNQPWHNHRGEHEGRHLQGALGFGVLLLKNRGLLLCGLFRGVTPWAHHTLPGPGRWLAGVHNSGKCAKVGSREVSEVRGREGRGGEVR